MIEGLVYPVRLTLEGQMLLTNRLSNDILKYADCKW